MELKAGNNIKFKFFSNIDPYPTCIGTIKHVYGISYLDSLRGVSTYFIDVEITEVLHNHWKQDLIGHTVRIRSDYEVEKVA